MIVAGIGIVVDAVAAWLFASGRKGELNIREHFCIWGQTPARSVRP